MNQGWKHIIEEVSGRPISEAILFGLISLHLEGNKLDAEALAKISVFQLGTVLQLPITEEKEVAPALRQARPHQISRDATSP
jgi:hypothetical protein